MKVYLAGGINGLSDADAKDWREQAKEVLHSRGHTTLDPMRRDYRGIEAQNAAAIVDSDLVDIDESDIMLAMCPRPSWGTAMEIFYAGWCIGKPVLVVCADANPSPWLLHHAACVYLTLADALAAIG